MAQDSQARDVIEAAAKRVSAISDDIVQLQAERDQINDSIRKLRDEQRLQQAIANAGRSRTRKKGRVAMTYDEPQIPFVEDVD